MSPPAWFVQRPGGVLSGKMPWGCADRAACASSADLGAEASAVATSESLDE